MTKKEGNITKKKLSKSEIDQALIDNFINLQRVLTNLTIKFDELSSNISKLLNLFEISAKNFAEKYPAEENGKVVVIHSSIMKMGVELGFAPEGTMQPVIEETGKRVHKVWDRI